VYVWVGEREVRDKGYSYTGADSFQGQRKIIQKKYV
jgi:hypothetical protein